MLKPAQATKEIFLEAVAFSYLQSSLEMLGNDGVHEAIKGKFPKIKYTTYGYDISQLSYDQKVDLINILFGLREDWGAVDQLEKITLLVKDRLGVVAAFEEALKDLPPGVFEKQKVALLGKEELQAELLRVLNDLKKTKGDIERIVSERTLHLSVEKEVLATTLFNASYGVFALNLEGKIVTFNKEMEELTGYAFEEVKGSLADDVVRLFEDSVPLTIDKYAPFIGVRADKNIYFNNKVTLVARNGSKRYVRLVGTIVAEGKRINLRGIVTLADITKEVELENMKLDFVSIAAHELRTPITAIRGYLSLLKDEVYTTDNKERGAYLEKCIVSADTLYILMENLLNVSRIERGQVEISEKCLNWIAVVKSVVELFIEKAQSMKVTIEIDERAVGNLKVHADEIMIREVLANLLDNAVGYNKEGGKVIFSFDRAGDFVNTHIKDTGAGIPQESLPHVFKKFYRASGILEQGKKGTGLGLFIAKEIVRLHGGKIWLESRRNEGSTFSFSLPVCND